MSAEMLAIVPRLAAAFNRSTLLTDSDQPDGENPADLLRRTRSPITTPGSCTPPNTDGLGYAFPYDDVAPAGGANQSGSVSSGSPAQLTVTVGPRAHVNGRFSASRRVLTSSS